MNLNPVWCIHVLPVEASHFMILHVLNCFNYVQLGFSEKVVPSMPNGLSFVFSWRTHLVDKEIVKKKLISIICVPEILENLNML